MDSLPMVLEWFLQECTHCQYYFGVCLPFGVAENPGHIIRVIRHIPNATARVAFVLPFSLFHLLTAHSSTTP
jgi:hypothetical protein